MRQADQGDDPGLKAAVRHGLYFASAFAGDLASALKHAEDGVALTRESPTRGTELLGYSPYIQLLTGVGWMLIQAGRPHEGAARLEQAIDLAQQHHQLTPIVASHFYFLSFSEVTGETETALEHGRKCVEAAEKTGNPFARVCAYFALGLAHLHCAQCREAVSALDQALTIARDRHTGGCWEGGVLASLASAHLGLGDHQQSRKAAEEALAVIRRRGTWMWEKQAQLAMARALMRAEGAGAAAAIEAALSAAGASIEKTGAKSYLPFVHLERAELARLLGDVQKRGRELHGAHRLFTVIGATRHAERLARELE